tara:strand:+ start:508 stop:2277 length:1770 start_codon:yes stop_codon:yes gene_type:complete
MTTPQKLIRNNKQYPDKIAISYFSHGQWKSMTWSEFYNYTLRIAKSLHSLGFKNNDKISIYSYNRMEWYACYLASQMNRGVAVGVYHTSSPDEIDWIINNSDSKFVFIGHNPLDDNDVEKMPYHRFMKIIDKLNKVEKVVLMENIPKLDHSKISSWENFLDYGLNVNESEIINNLNSSTLEETASIIYTSGTTGNPKGVELTHGNWSFEVESPDKAFLFQQGEKYISWLPLAHSLGQFVDIHYWVDKAMHLYIAESPLTLVDSAKEIQPHLFISVPRLYEKIYSNVKSQLDTKPILKILLKIPIISNLIEKKIKTAIGMSRCRYALTGAAPINQDILILFQSLNIPLFEGYGMTEDSAGASINYFEKNKIGTVGPALPGTEIKILSDGEIVIKGPHVMKGYYNNPEATKEVLKDGWLYTGDIGEIDKDGFLTIVGRKKEIYVTSGGKNIAPLNIEESMKSISLVSQCFLVGDGRNFCSALFTLDPSVILRDKLNVSIDEIPKNPSQQITKLKELGHSLEDYTESEEIKKEIQSQVDLINTTFSSPEQVKKFEILPRDFSVDEKELTPTLKLRRKKILQNWNRTIDKIYE